MKLPGISFIRRLFREESGQTLFIVMFSLAGFLALAGLSIEVGHAYYAYELLEASTKSATMAGASAMPNTTAAGTLVTAYSSVTGGKNANPMLQSVSVTPTYLCLTTVTNTF
jgi:Flp pilus assembly protein TadG